MGGAAVSGADFDTGGGASLTSRAGFEGGSMRLVVAGTAFWVQPTYLGADAQQFERNLLAATGVAVAY